MKPKESDWKLYSKLIPFWRDRYLQKRNHELVAILIQPESLPTDQFWEAKKRIGEVARILEYCLGVRSRSKMWGSILAMLGHGLITEEDLIEFSEELRGDVSDVLGRQKASASG